MEKTKLEICRQGEKRRGRDQKPPAYQKNFSKNLSSKGFIMLILPPNLFLFSKSESLLMHIARLETSQESQETGIVISH